ncbi:hypothetical protein OH708_26780, partial [Pseudomonas capsici]|uniref:hypothetical protein n=1 Tax=Pseudomonas capsici TaxID=2810614 RepID=UPI0019CF54D2
SPWFPPFAETKGAAVKAEPVEQHIPIMDMYAGNGFIPGKYVSTHALVYFLMRANSFAKQFRV